MFSFRKTSVATITSAFVRAVQRLEVHAEKQFAKAGNARTQMAAMRVKASEHDKEANAALKVAEKLEALLK